jgi:hypothetical protein
MRIQTCRVPRLLASVALALLALSACTTKGTIKATTDPTTDILSSTSGKTWFAEDGYVHDEYKAIAFASLNFTNLNQDMARGQGEYLASLGTILGVPADRQEAFGALAQAHYPHFMASARTTPADLLASLTSAMKDVPPLDLTPASN